MKTALMGVLVAITASYGVNARADVAAGAGVWKGRGVKFSSEGSKEGSFEITMVSKAVGKHELKSEITLTSKGATHSVEQTLKDAGDNSFEVVSTQGNGGGYCFGKGLCQAYLGEPSHGYAVTIVLDDPDTRRFLVTELQDGKAVRFIRQSLERVEE